MSGRPEIIFAPHARYQIKERKLDENAIMTVVRTPDKIIKQTDGRFRALKMMKSENKDYLLIVIYDKHNSTIEIITAFLTSKVKKYLHP